MTQPQEISKRTIEIPSTIDLSGTGYEPKVQVSLVRTGASNPPYVINITTTQQQDTISKDSSPIDQARSSLIKTITERLKKKNFLFADRGLSSDSSTSRGFFTDTAEISVTLNRQDENALLQTFNSILDMPPEQLLSRRAFLQSQLAALFDMSRNEDPNITSDALAKTAIDFLLPPEKSAVIKVG
jgi:hypothetical protein